ncbi:hypothetical protein AB0O05_18210 [Streptomyces sp. NPDC093084]|uniref:hypothetical protein n=1 Tax=Streptomyces sp. NPDC093084 TaxID=3155197 RepID=UPI00343F0560
MGQQGGPASAMALSRGKKIAVGVGGVVVVSAVVAGVGYVIKGGAAQDASAPVVSRSAPAVTASPEQTQAASGPARKLAGLDGSGRPADQYQQVLDALAPRCTEDRPRLVAVIDTTLENLRKNGVDDEDAFGVLQHLEQSVPAGNPRVACASAAADYATAREGG